MARTTEFPHTLFALGSLMPLRIMSTTAAELLTGNSNTLEEVEEDSDEMRLYREYYLSTSSGLLTSSLMEKK